MSQNCGVPLVLLISDLFSFFTSAVTVVALHRSMIRDSGFPLKLQVSGLLSFFIFAVTLLLG